MRPQFIMFLALVFMLSNVLCFIIDTGWFAPEDLTVMNYLTGYDTWTSGPIPVLTPIVGFFTKGFPKLILWDYSFIPDALQIIGWIMNVFTIGAIFAMAQEFRSVITSFFSFLRP